MQDNRQGGRHAAERDYDREGRGGYIFEAPDNLTAGKVAMIIRSFGHATTETWNAIPWDRFTGILEEIAA